MCAGDCILLTLLLAVVSGIQVKSDVFPNCLFHVSSLNVFTVIHRDYANLSYHSLVIRPNETQYCLLFMLLLPLLDNSYNHGVSLLAPRLVFQVLIIRMTYVCA